MFADFFISDQYHIFHSRPSTFLPQFYNLNFTAARRDQPGLRLIEIVSPEITLQEFSFTAALKSEYTIKPLISPVF